jgi:hypothetical protein
MIYHLKNKNIAAAVLFLIVVFVSSLLGPLPRHWNTTIANAQQVDPTPQTIFYAGFNNSQIASSSYSGISNQGVVFDANGKIGTGMRISNGFPGSAGGRFIATNTILEARRGSIAFWIRNNSTSGSGGAEVFDVYPGPPFITMGFSPNHPDPNNANSTIKGEITFGVGFDGAADIGQGISDTIGTGPFNFVPGDWHHVVWTWQGMHHKVYLDGQLATDKTMISPMPPQISPSFAAGIEGGWIQDSTIDELGIYNFAMTPNEVAAGFGSSVSAPFTPIDQHGLDATAQWGPGVGKVHVSADPGNDFESQASSYAIDILKDDQVIKSATISNLRRGFGESLIDLGGPLAAGTYKARVKLLDASSTTLATQDTPGFVVTATSWLGNNIGITDQVQPPWTPIQVNGTKLSVWGREYDLSGGFGLPTQITSKGQTMLSKPVGLDFDLGSGVFNLVPQSLQITSAQPNKVTWTGTASGNGITATVNGSLEYDGMVLINLSLTPTTGPVTINSLKLQTALPNNRALYYASTNDNTYWWYPHKGTVPTAAGTFLKNTDGYYQRTSLMPSIVFSDNDRGLEWFADSFSGWQVNSSLYSKTPSQQLIRDGNGDVRLENELANQTFTLSQPLNITFGYEATPIKPLPADWRTMQIGDSGGGGPAFPGIFDVIWSWPDDYLRNGVWGNFKLSPDNLATYTSRAAVSQQNGIKIAPYTDQHVTISSGTDVGSTQLYDLLNAENQNDGWTAMPTRGTQDYWAYNIKRTMDAGGMDAIYIDEPFANSTLSSSLLSGSGYLRQDGTHGVGYNSLGMRDQLKRIRQVIIDHGKRPVVWLHTTANMQPHAWAFADVISDGESFMFTSPTDPDWIDLWGSNPATPTCCDGIPWLMSIGRGEKYGFVTAFLNEIRFSHSDPAYTPAYRAMVGLEQLFDINPVGSYEQQWKNYMKPRVDFGITASDVAFHGYWEQTAITPDNSQVKSSYYGRTTSALAVITNLGEAYSGNVTINAAGLGLDPASISAIDAESKQPLILQAGSLSLSIPRHDYRMVQFTGNVLPAPTPTPTPTSTPTPTPSPTPTPDATPSSVSITSPINGATVTGSAVTVSANASDNIGVAGVQFLLDGANLGSQDTSSPYSTSWNSKNSSNGSHTVSARARDAVGNTTVSNPVNVIVDNQSPSGTVLIDNNAAATNTRSATLTLSATDTQGAVTQMRFSNSGSSYSTPQTYATSTAWTLTSGDGTKTVYAEFKDMAGNWSSAKTDTIIMDTTAPNISNQNTNSISSSGATITWTTNEPTTSQVNYGTTTNYGKNTTLNLTLVISHSVILTGLTSHTTYDYRVRSKDAAGNEKVSGNGQFRTK